MSRSSLRVVLSALALLPALTPSTRCQGVLGSVSLGGQPASQIALNLPAGRVYVGGGYAQNQLAVVDVTLPSAPAFVTTLGAAGAAALPAQNRFYCSNGFGGSILVFDGASNAVVTSAGIGYCGGQLAANPAAGLVYAMSQCGGGNDPVHVLDAATNTVVAGPLGSGGVANYPIVNPATGNLYAVRSGGTRVFGPAPGFGFVVDLPGACRAIDPVSNRLYFQSGANIEVRDGATHAVVTTISNVNGGNSWDVDAVRHRLYVPDATAGLVRVVDTLTNTAAGTFALAAGAAPNAVAVDGASNRLYVTATLAGATMLYVVAGPPITTPVTPVGTLSLGGQPLAQIALNLPAGRVYVGGGYAQNQLAVVDVTAPSAPVLVTTLVAAGAAALPAANRFYGTNGFGGSIHAFDGANNGLVATVPIGYCGGMLTADASTGLVYVMSQCGGGNDPVHVLDASTNTLVAGPLGSGGVANRPLVNAATGRLYAVRSGGTRVFGPAPGLPFVADLPGSCRAIDPVNNRLYFDNGGALQVLDGNTHAVLAAVPGLAVGGDWGVDSVARRLYLPDSPGARLRIVDGTSGLWIGSLQLPVGMAPQVVVADPATGRLYVAGPSGGATTLLLIDPPGARVPFGGGCGCGPNGPSIATSGLPVLGSSGFAVTASGVGTVGAVGLMFAGFVPATPPVPFGACSCPIHIDLSSITLLAPVVVGGGGPVGCPGTASYPMPLPAGPASLVGLPIFFQYGFLPSIFPACGFEVSNGLAVRIGL